MLMMMNVINCTFLFFLINVTLAACFTFTFKSSEKIINIEMKIITAYFGDK
jgi:hypothetical protein